MSDLIIKDGENQSVRMFLMLYGGGHACQIERMREHLECAGYPHWPDWAATATGHLTKGGAQSWIRYLFSLEQEACAATIEQLTKERDALKAANEALIDADCDKRGMSSYCRLAVSSPIHDGHDLSLFEQEILDRALRRSAKAAEPTVREPVIGEFYCYKDIHDYWHIAVNTTTKVFATEAEALEFIELCRPTREEAAQAGEPIEYDCIREQAMAWQEVARKIQEVNPDIFLQHKRGVDAVVAFIESCRRAPSSEDRRLYAVYHTEKYVGDFFQGAFSTREKAQAYIDTHTDWPPHEFDIDEITIDTAIAAEKGG